MKLEQLWQVLFALIVALASAYAGYWLGHQPEQLRVLEYRIYSEENLTGKLGKTDDLKITYKGVEQPDLSRVTIMVANTSETNAENVRLYFEVKEKGRIPIISDFIVPDGYPRNLVKPLPNGNGIHSYELDYMNRTVQFWDGFRFTFYFAGSKAPEIDVRAAAKGFTLRKYEVQDISTSRIFIEILANNWWMVLLYFGGMFLFLRYVRIGNWLHRENVKRHVYSLLPDNLPATEKAKRAEEGATAILRAPSFGSVLKHLFHWKRPAKSIDSEAF